MISRLPIKVRLICLTFSSSLLLASPQTFCQEPEDEIIDIQVNSITELEARRQAEALNNQGYEQLEAEYYREAESLFRQALAMDSTSLLYYENLARSLGGQQKIKEVVETYRRAQRQFPDASDLYYYQADALQKLKRYEAAREGYTQAIVLSKKNPETQLQHLYYFNRGNTYLKEGDYAAARQDYDEALRINEFHYGSYANRGFARYKLNDQPGACTDWHKALESGYDMARQYLTKYCQ